MGIGIYVEKSMVYSKRWIMDVYFEEGEWVFLMVVFELIMRL